MSEILNELGVFVITIGISIAIFIGIHLKTKPAPSEKETNRSTYIGVWLLANFTAINFIYLFFFVAAKTTPELFRELNPPLGQLIILQILGMFIYFFTIYRVYINFSYLNFVNVIPYIWLIGFIIIFVWTTGAYYYHERQFIYPDDANAGALGLSVAFGLILSFILLSKALGVAEQAKNANSLKEKTKLKQQTIDKAGEDKKPNKVALSDDTKEKKVSSKSVSPEKSQFFTKLEVGTETNKIDIGSSTVPNKASDERHLISVNADKYPKAAIVIEYDKKAGLLWSNIKSYDHQLQIEFLEGIEEDPNRDFQNLYDEILKADEIAKNPYTSEDANAAFQAACAISPEAKVEFEKVYDLLGQKISPSEILQKIKRKFG